MRPGSAPDTTKPSLALWCRWEECLWVVAACQWQVWVHVTCVTAVFGCNVFGVGGCDCVCSKCVQL